MQGLQGMNTKARMKLCSDCQEIKPVREFKGEGQWLGKACSVCRLRAARKKYAKKRSRTTAQEAAVLHARKLAFARQWLDKWTPAERNAWRAHHGLIPGMKHAGVE